MSLINDLVNRFGEWVKDLFSNAEKLYNKLTDEEKKAAEWSYGVIAILNNYADDVPQALEVVGIKYPELSSSVLHGFLDELLLRTKTVVSETPLTLEEAAFEVASYLGKLEGETWQSISQTFGNILAILFSPTTPIQKFISSAEYVYRAIVKPHVEAK